MSKDSYEDMLEPGAVKRRPDVLNELRALRGEVRARNASLNEDEAEALTERVSREIVDGLADSGTVSFERDER
jgi:hypothetical protein